MYRDSYRRYLGNLHRDADNLYEIAEKARRLGHDPKPFVEIPQASDLADRTQKLLSYLAPRKTAEQIRELTETIASVIGYTGSIEWDTSKPNGTMRKVMDVSKVNDLGWKASTDLREGVELAYQWSKDNVVI